MTGDGRLMRNAIEQLDNSRTAEGATYSRAPSHLQQYIPPFSLWWIGMLHDYWMYQDDPVFVRSMLPGVRAVLSFFAAHQKPGGSLGRVPWWNFVDWTKEWENGVPPTTADGSTAAARSATAARLPVGRGPGGGHGIESAGRTSTARRRPSCAPPSAIFIGIPRAACSPIHPRKTDFSQHAQALAVLAGVVRGKDATDLIDARRRGHFAGPVLHLLPLLPARGAGRGGRRRPLPGSCSANGAASSRAG